MISTRYLKELAYKVIDNRLSLAKAKKIAGDQWNMFEAIYLDTKQFRQNIEIYEDQVQSMRIISIAYVEKAIDTLNEMIRKR